MLFIRHPRYATLNRFADGELEPREHRRVSAHLAQCSRCRQEVAFIRGAGNLARYLEAPPVPDGILDRVLERRAEGERVLLPQDSPGAVTPVHWRVVPAAAAAIVLFVAGLFLTTGILEADRGRLRVVPEHPTAGDTLTIHYDGGFQFADQEVLELKARYRTATGRSWEQIAGILEPGDEGGFVAPVALPDSVVYAAFAVETLDGQTVDSNNGELWEVLVFGPDGRPTKRALWERFADLYSRRDANLRAQETARHLTDLYPESPRGWAARWFLDGERAGPADADSIAASYRARFRLLERTLTQSPPVDPDELAVMAYFGGTLGEYASGEYWLRQARSRGSRSSALYQAETYLVGRTDGQPPAEMLKELESIWQAAPFPMVTIADRGWHTATRFGDWDTVLRWLPRYRETRGWGAQLTILNDLEASFGPDRVLGWALANAEDALFRPTHRRLGQTTRFHARREAVARQLGLASLARMAQAAGRPRVARAFALEAMPLAWETQALETVGRILLATGDTANARAAYARAAADPLGGSPPAAITRSEDWAEMLRATRSELTRYVLRESLIGYPETDLGMAGRPTVIAFEQGCTALERRLPAIADALGDAAFRVVLVRGMGQTPPPSCDLPVPIRLDWSRDISRDYGVLGVPAYIVLDAEGRIRFRPGALEDVPRELAALRTVTAPSVAD